MAPKALLLGAGRATPQRFFESNVFREEPEWVRLDINPACKPDVVFDLDALQRGHTTDRLPFEADTFDEIHAYEVLEHIGRQGDYRGFFREFAEYWRVLKPDGIFCATVPDLTSPWLWGDPGHTRAITHGTITFLTRDVYAYSEQATTDYRYLIDPHWWDLQYHETKKVENGAHRFCFALTKSDLKRVQTL